MQAVNEVAQTPPFMVVLFGTALVTLVLAVQGVRRRGLDGWLTAAGAATFLVGVIGLTVVVNVPLNDALAALPVSADPARAWAEYAPAWTAANHVRAAAGIAAAVLLAVARFGRPRVRSSASGT